MLIVVRVAWLCEEFKDKTDARLNDKEIYIQPIW